jgi:multiple antibiotic resistance protein
MSTVFLMLTKNFEANDRIILAKKVFKYGSVLLISTYCFGSFILNAFGISMYALQIAGGLIIFASSWKLLNSKHEENELKIENPKQLAFYPLTMPLTAGAGAISVSIALSANVFSSSYSFVFFITMLAQIIGIIGIMFFTYLCYRYSELITKKLGTNGVLVITKLTAFLLIAIGVGMIGSGIKSFIHVL